MTDVVKIGYEKKDTRWKATIIYRVDANETRTAIHHVDEIKDLQELIEVGPTFCAIEDFRIEYWGPKQTIKEAMED